MAFRPSADTAQRALQQLLLRQEPLIQLIDARQALLDRGNQLLLQQGDFLLAIGLLDPGAAQRQPEAAPQDLLHRAQGGFEQQERILFCFAERTFRCDPAERRAGYSRGAGREHGHGIGAKSGAATGPIPVETRRQESLRLERTGASPQGAYPLAAVGRSQPNGDLTYTAHSEVPYIDVLPADAW